MKNNLRPVLGFKYLLNNQTLLVMDYIKIYEKIINKADSENRKKTPDWFLQKKELDLCYD